MVASLGGLQRTLRGENFMTQREEEFHIEEFPGSEFPSGEFPSCALVVLWSCPGGEFPEI